MEYVTILPLSVRSHRVNIKAKWVHFFKKKQRLQSEINAHHTSKSVKLKCILQQRIKKKKNGNGRRVLKVYQLSEMLRLVPFMLQSVPCSDVLLKIDYILF